MPNEIEAKHKVGSFAAVQRALRRLGAEFLGAAAETDVYFDTPDGTLRRTDRGIRIRTREPITSGTSGVPCSYAMSAEGHVLPNMLPQKTRKHGTPVLVTYKGPLKKGRLKVRQEIQTHAADAKAMAGILSALGLRPDVTVRKRRTSFRLGGCMVELDVLPRIGRFVEVEGPTARAVGKVCSQLGLTGEPIRKPYVAMVAELKAKR